MRKETNENQELWCMVKVSTFIITFASFIYISVTAFYDFSVRLDAIVIISIYQPGL